MKKMNHEDFQKRVNEVNKAFRIFSPLTNNMTEAFRLYLEVLAEEQYDLFISTEVYGNRPMTPIDDYERPLCPDCQSPMRFRPVPQNDEGVNTQLVCENCDLVLDSEKTIQEWYQMLEKKSDNGLSEDTEKTE
jgi:hypothetical protein